MLCPFELRGPSVSKIIPVSRREKTLRLEANLPTPTGSKILLNEPPGVGGTRLAILREGMPLLAFMPTWGGHAGLALSGPTPYTYKILGCLVDNIHHISHIIIKNR